jgi:GST-like protein
VPFLGGATYSIADIATFPWLRNADMLVGAAKSQYPNVLRWVDAIAARPSVVRALQAVDEVRARTTQFDKAEAEIVDKVMGRGQYAAA